MIQITPLEDATYQALSLNLPIRGSVKRVSLELKYEEKPDRWYMSMYDLQTNEVYFLHIPLLSTGNAEHANNLFLPFSYKDIGALACFPKSDNVETENPSKDNLKDFYIIWGDGVAD